MGRTPRLAGMLEEFMDVLIGICDGWHLGYNEPLSSTFSPKNHLSALQNADTVCAYISKEILAGRYSQAFNPAQMTELFHNYCTSPISIVLKHNKP